MPPLLLVQRLMKRELMIHRVLDTVHERLV